MAKVATIIIVAMVLGIFHQVSAASEPELCTPLGHPDWDCRTPLICEKDWPSETGNYGSGNVDTKIIVGSKSLRRLFVVDSEVNSTAARTDIHGRRSATIAMSQASQNHSSVPSKSTFSFPKQCCRPTVECYKFFAEHDGITAVDYNGRLLIDDYNLWKKAECCMSDFMTPKSWCLTPPPRNSWFTWDEPPACTKFH